MPVVGIPVDMLLTRLSTTLDRDELVEHLQHLGCDVEGYATVDRYGCGRCGNIMETTATENAPVRCDRCGVEYKDDSSLLRELGQSDVVRMELLAVRPDVFDPGGLARMLRQYLGEGDEPARYTVNRPTWRVTVDPQLAEPTCLRPSIACAIVRGITLDDDLVKVIMKLQENLHWALGRDRKHASIGVYDLAHIKGPTIAYRACGPEDVRFVPLGFSAEDADSRLTPRAVLERHPKGIAYARLLAGFTHYPLLSDAEGGVLSLIPVINSEHTRVRSDTRDFFIDVTGSGDRIVDCTLNILVTSLAELDRAATIEAVTIAYADREVVTPDLTPQTATVSAPDAARMIGVELSTEDVARCLRRMGHAVSAGHEAGVLTVEVPAYRNDIMHPIDLVEDVAIAYGYHNIVPSLVPTLTIGSEQPAEVRGNTCRGALTGLGYLEVMTLILSSERTQYDAMGLDRSDDGVVIDNPISEEQTMIRTSLAPGLLDTLAANTDHELPQRIFEVGNVSQLDGEAETGARECGRVASAAIGPRVDYAEIRSACESLLREIGWQLEAEAVDSGCYIPGRGARVIARRDGGGPVVVGHMGEVHPEVLERFKLSHPAALFELDLDALA